ncbi:MAG: amino acid permease [Actinobacteria bacterium 21-73-9]|nr:MAG: amino acid permease [Actinobacteria bacterium 21-73-9]
MSEALETPAAPAHEHSLKAGVLGLFDSVIMGVAGVAPAYSIAGTTAVLFGAVGFGGPAALLYCGVAMFGIVFAFSYLGRVETNAGASYSWVRRALHPALGYLSGWALVVSALIFMVIATLPVGSNLVSLFSNSLASNKLLVTLVGCVFFLLMVAAVAAGVTVTVTVQIIMSTIELALLVLFALLAIFHAHANPFTWHWFSPGIFHGSSGFFAGALVAAFYYWGWDVTANLNEEIGIVVVFLLFEVFTVATNMVLTTHALSNPNNAADILSVLGQKVWHGTGGKLIVISVILSTVATLETTLIQVTRTLFAMGRDHTLPKALGRIAPNAKTPLVATITVMVISLALFVGSQSFGSIANILTAGVNSIGLQIAIYYCFAGLAVVVLYRRQIFRSASNFVFMGLWPLVGAVFMGVMFIKVIPTLTNTDLWVGLGSMALGLIPMAYYWAQRNPYFDMPAKEDRHAVVHEFEENL